MKQVLRILVFLGVCLLLNGCNNNLKNTKEMENSEFQQKKEIHNLELQFKKEAVIDKLTLTKKIIIKDSVDFQKSNIIKIIENIEEIEIISNIIFHTKNIELDEEITYEGPSYIFELCDINDLTILDITVWNNGYFSIYTYDKEYSITSEDDFNSLREILKL